VRPPARPSPATIHACGVLHDFDPRPSGTLKNAGRLIAGAEPAGIIERAHRGSKSSATNPM